MIRALLGLVSGTLGKVSGLASGLLGGNLLLYVAAAVSIAVSVQLLMVRGQLAACRAEHQAHLLDDATQQAARLQAVQQTERGAASASAAIDQSLAEDLDRALQAARDVPAALDAGTLRLRPRFTCADTATAQRLPGPAASAAGGHAQTGLRPADAGFLVQQADECDARLTACQAQLVADRKVCNGR